MDGIIPLAIAARHSSQIEELTDNFADEYNPVLPSYSAYDSTATYAVGDKCIYSGSAYVCKTAITTAEAFDSTKWTVIPIYAIGDLVTHDNVLYKCTTAVTTVETWTAAHWTEVNVGDKVKGITEDLNNIRINFTSPNLLDINNMTAGYIGSNGSIQSSSELTTSDYFPVNYGDTIRAQFSAGGVRYDGQVGGGGFLMYFRFAALYDSNKQFISGSHSQTTYAYSVLNDSAKYMRVTYNNRFLTDPYYDLAIINSSSSEIEPYYEYGATENRIKSKAMPNIPKRITKNRTSLSAGEEIVLYTPEYTVGRIISFSADIVSMGSISIINGDRLFNGKKIVITSSEISLYTYSSNSQWELNNTVQHGLTISDRISVIISTDNIYTGHNNNAKVTVISIGGSYSTTLTMFDGFSSIKVYNDSTSGGSFTNAYVSVYCKKMQSDTWIFGDSYTQGYTTKLTDLGITNYLADGRSGRGSAGAYTSFLYLIRNCAPKRIVWLMGMNDHDSDTEINSSWKSVVDAMISRCEDNGIELILSTIPNVPTINHSFKNAYVKSKGLRYIDACKAVGADTNTSWYTGLQRSDGVHPTDLGYSVLTGELVTIVPELE